MANGGPGVSAEEQSLLARRQEYLNQLEKARQFDQKYAARVAAGTTKYVRGFANYYNNQKERLGARIATIDRNLASYEKARQTGRSQAEILKQMKKKQYQSDAKKNPEEAQRQREVTVKAILESRERLTGETPAQLAELRQTEAVAKKAERVAATNAMLRERGAQVRAAEQRKSLNKITGDGDYSPTANISFAGGGVGVVSYSRAPVPSEGLMTPAPSEQGPHKGAGGHLSHPLQLAEPPPSKAKQFFSRVKDSMMVPIHRALGNEEEAATRSFLLGDTRGDVAGGLGSAAGYGVTGAGASVVAIPLAFATGVKYGTEFFGDIITSRVVGGGSVDIIRGLPDREGIKERGLLAERQAIASMPGRWGDVIKGDFGAPKRAVQSALPFFGVSDTARENVFKAELERRGFQGERLTEGVKGLEGARISSTVGVGLGLFAAIESYSEIAGARIALSKGVGSTATKRFTQTAAITGPLGVGEGAASYIFSQQSVGSTVSPRNVVYAGLLGGASSALLGGFIGSQATAKGLSKSGRVGLWGGRALDFPGEMIGDALGGGVTRTLQRIPGLRVVSPSFSPSASTSTSSAQQASTQRTVSGPRIASTPVSTPSYSFIPTTPSSSFSAVSSPSASVPSSINIPTYSNVPSFSSVPISSNVPTSSNIPAFSQTPSFSSVPTSSNVPTFSQTPSLTTTPAMSGGMFFPPFWGGGKGFGTTFKKGKTPKGRGFGWSADLMSVESGLSASSFFTPVGGFSGLEARPLFGAKKKATKKGKKKTGKKKPKRRKKR